MDAANFAVDVAAKPGFLEALAQRVESGSVWEAVAADTSRVIFVGMGSSHCAASVMAARLRARGVTAIAELASSQLLPAPRHGDFVVVVSATGNSQETLAAAVRYKGIAPVVLLTNAPTSPLHEVATGVVLMHAGIEAGGVACRSFQHTLALLLALEQRLAPDGLDVPSLLRRAAQATADLIGRAPEWIPLLRPLLDGPDGLHVVAPAHRLSSAQQSALMWREGPRRVATACETGDWSHVDVYLTKTTDYRMLLLPGSPWEAELLSWVRERTATLVAVGAAIPGADATLRYVHDDDDDVRLLTETVVSELLSADVWLSQ